MTTSTNHTVLVAVTSLNSGGRGKMLVKHHALVDGFTDVPFLTSKHFQKFHVGDIVIADVRLSGTRRIILGARQDERVTNRRSFMDVYGTILENEADNYNRVHGLPAIERATEAPKDEEVEMKRRTIPWGSRVGAYPDEEIEGKVTKRVSSRDPVTGEWKRDVWSEPARVHDPKPEPEPTRDETDWSNTIYVDPEDRVLLETVRVLAQRKHVAIMMIGPSGYGKTSIPEQMASEWGMGFLRWDCATVRDPEEFFGYRGAFEGSTMDDDGNTLFVESEFTRAIQEGNVVIVLDELNRIDPYISNILFPLLDHAGRTSVAGHEIRVGPNVVFTATINMGYQFTGTFTLDTALTNRFIAKILVDALPEDVERKILMARGGVSERVATQIVDVMKGLRKLNKSGQLSVDASTRVSIQVAELVGAGLDIRRAIVYVIINGISEDESKLVIDQMGAVL